MSSPERKGVMMRYAHGESQRQAAKLAGRVCRVCGEGVTSSHADVDYCVHCFYDGVPFAERFAGMLADLNSLDGPEFGVCREFGVWHTGGGCFTIAARVDGTIVDCDEDSEVILYVNGGDATLPDTPAGPWAVHYDRYCGEVFGSVGVDADFCGTLSPAEAVAAVRDMLQARPWESQKPRTWVHGEA